MLSALLAPRHQSSCAWINPDELIAARQPCKLTLEFRSDDQDAGATGSSFRLAFFYFWIQAGDAVSG